jgi:hypothetical protein
MASGFIILKDGRCASPRYTGYDAILQRIVECLPAGDFRDWLLAQTADETQDEESGFGGFYRRGNIDDYVKRWLDLRELTEANQALFWKAAAEALTGTDNETIEAWLRKMLEMNRLAEAGDHPDNLSDWAKGYVEPPSGNKSGPGWD